MCGSLVSLFRFSYLYDLSMVFEIVYNVNRVNKKVARWPKTVNVGRLNNCTNSTESMSFM